MKKELLIIAAFLTLISGISNFCFATTTGTPSNEPTAPNGKMMPSSEDLYGEWVFFKLKEIDPVSGEIDGVYYAHSNYHFGADASIIIDGTLYDWDLRLSEGSIEIAGIEFEITFYEEGKLILKDGTQLFYLKK